MECGRAGGVVRSRGVPWSRPPRPGVTRGKRLRPARRHRAIRAAGHMAKEVVCVAGGARGDLLRQIRADVTGLPITRPDDVETTARGAAMLAAAGVGLHPDVSSAARAMGSARSEPLLPRPE